MNAMHRKIPTCDRPSAIDVACFTLACFPFAALLALVFWGDWIFPAAALFFQ